MYRLKKSLGQHFLKDKQVIDKILQNLSQCSFHSLLEVGPGGGALTEKLLKLPDIHFLAVEVDKEKVDYLSEKFPELKIIHGDFLKMEKPFKEPFSIIGNFPYNISSQILFRIVDWFPEVENVVGMFQKEVAQRIAASPGSKSFGIISVLIQYYYDVQFLFTVKKEAFNPPPKVESAVIRLTTRKNLLAIKDKASFRRIVKTAFAQRRKTLRNNLKGIIPAEKLNNPLFDRRAETLTIQEFASLSFEL